MTEIRQASRRVRDAALGTLAVRVLLLAIRNYVLHQSANQAGSLAFSWVLAMFPLVILLSTSAAYFGQPGDAARLVEKVIAYTPALVQDEMRPAIDQVLARRNQVLLTIGLLATLWTGSSGLQAIRTALNRAYGIERGLPFWKARIKVTIFTIVAGLGLLTAFSSIVIMPYVWRLLEANAAASKHSAWVGDTVRYGTAFLVLLTVYAFLYGWLPDTRQRLRTVLPGALVGAALWDGAAATLAYTLRSASDLALLYGSFAGLAATLVFFYVNATTLIFGAEINGVLRADETREPPSGI